MRKFDPIQLSYLTESQWLDMPFEHLKFEIKSHWINDCLREVKEELKQKGIKPFFHAWVSDEWFSPDGCPGIAVPFYLFHPMLSRSLKKYGLPVEGLTKSMAKKLIRHEVGHAIENAWRLRRKRQRQLLFGLTSTPYPTHYRPKANSTDFVTHLQDDYSQAHPDEDWAETFAVWLSTSKRHWIKKYSNTKALRKLEYCDKVMSEIAGTKPVNTEKFVVDPIKDFKGSIRDYLHKRSRQRLKTIIKLTNNQKLSPKIISPDILKQAQDQLYKKNIGILM
tara:strand:+ start:153 stop:986 length:834 start_codon:yes stop_codon:yes gene_type:complete